MVELDLDFSKLVGELEISSKSPDYTTNVTGNFMSNFKGQGMEFENFREYTPEDDAKKIDWLASTKADKLLIREFTEERGVAFFILVDVSYGMFFSSADKLKCEVAAEVCANLSFSMVEANDKVGIGLFGDDLKDFLLPMSGKVHFHKILEKLKNDKLYGGEKNYARVFERISNMIKEKVVLIVISDFLEFGDSDKEYLKLIGSRFDVIGYMVRDYRELELERGTGLISVEDVNSMEQLVVNVDEVCEEYREIMEGDEIDVKNFFLQNGFSFFKMYTKDEMATTLMRFMNSR